MSTVASSMAFQSQQIAMGWLAYDLTESPFALGLVLISWGIPAIAFSLVGGVVADSRNRRRTMLFMTMITAAAALPVGILVTTNQVALWHLMLSGVLSGTAIALNMPSRQAFIFDILGPESLPQGIAINSGAINVMRLLSPGLAGVLIGVIGVDLVYYLVVVSYVISTIILVLPLKAVVETIPRSSRALRDLADGFRYIHYHKTVFWLLTLALVTMFVGLPFSTLMPAFAVESLSLGPEGYGLLMSMVGVGAILGSVLPVFVGTSRRTYVWLMASVMAWGVSLTAFSLSTSLTTAVPLAILLGMTSTGAGTIDSILIQTEVESRYLGRVLSFYMLTFSMSMVATLPIGALAELFGTTAALGWSGVLLVFLCLPLSLWARSVIVKKEQSPASF